MNIIGIDGGGTKTRFACFDEAGKVLYRCDVASCHILQVSKEKCIELLQAGFVEICNHIEGISPYSTCICAGMAGYGKNEALRKQWQEAFALAFPMYNVQLYGDVEIAIEAALNGQDGIVVIAGTGSIAFAKHQGKTLRCGGFGYTLGDEGSAYWIAKQVLAIFCKQADGRLAKSALFDMIMAYGKLHDVYEIIPYINQTLHNDREQIAKLAILAYEAAQVNDPYAIAIYAQAAQEIADMVQVLATHFEGEITLSYIGGVWNAGALLKTPLQALLETRIHITKPQYEPEYGAYLLAHKSGSSHP